MKPGNKVCYHTESSPVELFAHPLQNKCYWTFDGRDYLQMSPDYCWLFHSSQNGYILYPSLSPRGQVDELVNRLCCFPTTASFFSVSVSSLWHSSMLPLNKQDVRLSSIQFHQHGLCCVNSGKWRLSSLV